MQETITALLTDDSTSWIKTAVLLAILIVGYVISIRLYKKVNYRLGRYRKRDIAKSRNHIIKASLVDQHRHKRVDEIFSPERWFGFSERWSGFYVYTFNGEQRRYKAYFGQSRPPKYLILYYIDNPEKVFSCEEHRLYEHLSTIVFLFFIILPWILAGLAGVLMGVS